MILRNREYDRARAVEYAHRWAYFRNPAFYDFSAIGGDCTNYASQCIFAGSGVMNFTPTFGWYYIDINDRAPAWTGVKYLYNFLINNTGPGPYGREVSISEVRPGDICQLIIDEPDWQHSPVIVAVGRNARTYANIWVAAHSYDCDCRPLSSYAVREARFIHIEGVREIAASNMRSGGERSETGVSSPASGTGAAGTVLGAGVTKAAAPALGTIPPPGATGVTGVTGTMPPPGVTGATLPDFRVVGPLTPRNGAAGTTGVTETEEAVTGLTGVTGVTGFAGFTTPDFEITGPFAPGAATP